MAATSASGTGGAAGVSTGGVGAMGPDFAINFEIGGKIVVLTLGTPSAGFAVGLSINETGSILGAGRGFSLSLSAAMAVFGAAVSFLLGAVESRHGLSVSRIFDSFCLREGVSV